jgi:hypothetical protein
MGNIVKKSVFALLAFCAVLVQARDFALNNPYIRLKINNAGGRIERFYFIPAKADLTTGEGLLGDNFWNIPDSRFFLSQLNYDPIPGKQSLNLKAHHTGGGIDFLEVAKTVKLPEDEAMVTVDYRFTNLPAAMADLEYGFWCRNFAGAANRKYTYFFPCLNGISFISPQNQNGEHWFNALSRGWAAFAGQDGAGMAITMDYAHLKSFYGWYGKTGATLEWNLEKIKIPMGKSLDTAFEFIPFTGLKKVSGAGKGLVGEFNIAPEKAAFQTPHWLKRDIILKVYSAKKQKITLKVTARVLPNGATYDIGSAEMNFDRPTESKTYRTTYTFPVAAQAYDMEARAFDADGNLLAIFNTPAEISSILNYNMLPELERDGGTARPQVDLTRLDNSIETPHIQWGKPLKGGKIKVLALTRFPAYRELAELAQRLDIELLSMVWTLPYKALFNYGPYYGVLTDENVLDNFNRLLSRDYDVILLAGINWEHLTPLQRAEIARRVKDGCGFVEINNSGKTPELAEISAFAENDNVGTAAPKRERRGFLTTAVPFELFPRAIHRKGKALGEVHVSSGGTPWVVQRPVGKGRTVGINWYTGGGHGRMVSGVTPELPYPMAGAPFRDYTELYQLMIAKAVMAAAGREPAVYMEEITCTPGNGGIGLKLRLGGSFEAGAPLRLSAFTRSRDNEELTEKTFEFAAAETVALNMPATPWGGAQLLGLVLSDAAGEVLDFGAVAVRSPGGAEIRSLKAERDLYAEGENAVFTVEISKPGYEIRWSLIDAYGRVTASGLEGAPGARVRIEAPVTNSLKMRHYDFRAELLENGVPADRMETAITVAPAPAKTVWDDYEPGIWLTLRNSDAIRPYLHPLLAEKLRELRMQTILGNARRIDVDFAVQYNFNPTLFQHAGTHGARVSPEYQKTGDKMLLVRNPCLSNPEFYDKKVEEFKALGEKYASYAPRYYWYGDELSLSGYWSTPIDFCFSPTCLVHFREFLMRKYGSLDGVNRQWGTNYGKLDDVLPETAAEARKHTDGNYSAWSDHLEYMDGLLLEYIGKISEKGLRAADPNARTFISGPQAASAYGGNDWYRQSGIYSGMMTYEAGGLYELMRSFAPDGVNLPWIIGYDHVGGQVCYNLWKSLMFGARGAMAFHAPSLINPDFTFAEGGRAAAEYLPEIVDGVGKLVLNALSERPSPEIMIVYSQPSIRSAFIQGRAKEHENLRWKYVMLCRNFGIPFRFVSDDQIEKGMLAEVKPALVVFPDSNALSDACLKQIAGYIGQGGKIVLEGNFAGMDASCRAIGKRPLPSGKSVWRAEQVHADYFDAWSKPRLQRSENDWKALDNGRRIFAEVLKRAGIVPLCRVLQADGTPYLDAELDIMTDRQGNRYALIISKEENPAEVRLEFSGDRHVRDIRGKGFKLANSNPIFTALLDAEEKTPLSLEAQVAGRELKLAIDAGYPRDTAIRLTVIAPDGKEVQWYSANLNAPLGKAAHALRFALNDPSGEWKVRAREIVSGREAETVVRID